MKWGEFSQWAETELGVSIPPPGWHSGGPLVMARVLGLKEEDAPPGAGGNRVYTAAHKRRLRAWVLINKLMGTRWGMSPSWVPRALDLAGKHEDGFVVVVGRIRAVYWTDKLYEPTLESLLNGVLVIPVVDA